MAPVARRAAPALRPVGFESDPGAEGRIRRGSRLKPLPARGSAVRLQARTETALAIWQLECQDIVVLIHGDAATPEVDPPAARSLLQDQRAARVGPEVMLRFPQADQFFG